MYESSQYLIGCIVACSLIVGIGAAVASLFSDPDMETPRYDAHGKRIGNRKDQSRSAIETRSRLATGRTADGSCDYCSPRSRH